MNKKNIFLGLLLLHVHFVSAQSSPRIILDFNKNWKFFLGNDSTAIKEEYNDSKWRSLNLPHDWSIESDFKKEFPATNQGGALPGGIGWYRKTFVLPPLAKAKNVRIEFDGVYRNSEVWINGHYLGKRPNGYVSFYYELAGYLKPAPQQNIIAVKVDNSQQPNSRWYTGSGIYRDVKLIFYSPYAAVGYGRPFITTYDINSKEAHVDVPTILTSSIQSEKSVLLSIGIYDAGGKLVAGDESGDLREGGYRFTGNNMRLAYSTNLLQPKLWSPSSPYLYKAVVRVLTYGKKVIDEVSIRFGIRYFHFDSKKGFLLNGKPLKIQGVCMHHDLGALGAAFNKAAAKRQLKILKEMGCNAIRTSHNPPAAEFLDLCDELGFLVIDEAFDMWEKRKNKFDYHLDFKEWHKKDIQDMVLRDRNHPSVIMWSIGNEIREQFESTGIALTKELVGLIKSIDPTRPVISALTENFPDKNFIYKADTLDVLGFNYKLNDYKELPKRFSGEKFIALETASALATRGVYDLPSDSMRIWPPDSKQPFTNGNTDMTVSAYDNAYAYWGATHERSLQAVNKYGFIAGSFVWSGFDFLGEPVPYPWPARSSYYGIIDLAGFPKDVYYMYQSVWTNKPVLHIFPHWTWPQAPAGEPGKIIDVWAYYNNADEVELFLNGRSLGIKKKLNDEMHVMWRVPFQPGTLKAISRRNKKLVLAKEIHTAGKPARIELTADRKIIRADGKDLSFITIRILDENGYLVPDADNFLEFSVSGEGMLTGTDNGYQADTISLKSNKRKCWKGMALAIIQSSEKKGNITVKASGEGLKPSFFVLKTGN